MDEVSRKAEHEAIAKAVGEALSQWSYVESGLEDLFAIALGVEEGPAHIVMASIRSFRTRLLVVNNVLTSMGLSPEIRATWTNLYNRMARKNDKRNELAHYTIIHTTDARGRNSVGLHPYFSSGLSLMQGSQKPLEPPPQPLSSKQIRERGLGFAHLAIDIRKLSAPLAELLMQRQQHLGLPRYRVQAPSSANRLNPKEPQDPPPPSEV